HHAADPRIQHARGDAFRNDRKESIRNDGCVRGRNPKACPADRGTRGGYLLCHGKNSFSGGHLFYSHRKEKGGVRMNSAMFAIIKKDFRSITSNRNLF